MTTQTPEPCTVKACKRDALHHHYAGEPTRSTICSLSEPYLGTRCTITDALWGPVVGPRQTRKQLLAKVARLTAELAKAPAKIQTLKVENIIGIPLERFATGGLVGPFIPTCKSADTLGSLTTNALAAALRRGDGRGAEQFASILAQLETSGQIAKTA